jgi:hypothetical protein
MKDGCYWGKCKFTHGQKYRPVFVVGAEVIDRGRTYPIQNYCIGERI